MEKIQELFQRFAEQNIPFTSGSLKSYLEANDNWYNLIFSSNF